VANHTNNVLIVRVNGQEYVKGDAFYPQTTEKILEATRLTLLSDAKKYVKTAAKRLKMDASKLQIVQAVETRDGNFKLINVEIVDQKEANNGK